MIEAPIQIDDEYVRTYLWEHNLVAVDKGDLRKLMQPAKLLAIPALMEQAGWVRKREWQGLTDEEAKEVWKQLNYELNHGKFADDNVERHVIVELCRAIEAKLQEKNT